jgi:hypothetical protein
MKRDVPSEAKIQCICCVRKMKFRELRKHLKKTHNIPNVSITCTKDLESGDTCEFFCSFSLDCFLEHNKHCHNKLFEGGAATIFDLNNGFGLFESDVGRDHSRVCQDARDEKRKEKMREAKARWSAKQGSASDNRAVINIDEVSEYDGEGGTIKVTTAAGTFEVENVDGGFIKKKSPIIIKIRKRSLNEAGPSGLSVAEPVRKKRKVKPAKNVKNVTPTQQVARYVSTHQPELVLELNMPPLINQAEAIIEVNMPPSFMQPEINLLVNMPIACIQTEISEDPDDVSAIQADLMGQLDDSDDEQDIEEEVTIIEDEEVTIIEADEVEQPSNPDDAPDAEEDLESIQAGLNAQLDDSDDDDVEDIDEHVIRDDGEGTDFRRLYRKWGVKSFDMMARRLGGRQMLKLVMRKTKISYLDHAKLLVWNELNPVKQKLFD